MASPSLGARRWASGIFSRFQQRSRKIRERPKSTSATAPSPTTTLSRETSYGTNITREGVEVPTTEVADSVNKTTSATSTLTQEGVVTGKSKSTGIKK